MDQIGRKIIFELQRDGRMTNAELAERVGLSPSPCLRRVRQLEKDDIIQGYRAILNRKTLGLGFEVFVSVVMRYGDSATIASFEQETQALSLVLEVHRLFGDPDYLLRIGVADIGEYEHFYAKTLTELPGIAYLTSHVVMKGVKNIRELPVRLDRPQRA